MGIYEPQEMHLLSFVIEPGMRMVDIGANHGFFSLLAAIMTGSKGAVVCLEPDPRLYRQLCYNIQLNGFSHVQAKPVAAANRNEIATLYGFAEAEPNQGTSSLVCTQNPTHIKFEVQTRRLDTVLSDYSWTHVDLVKIDVEGFEIEVLEGMEEGLANGFYRRLLLELHPKNLEAHGRSVSEAIGLLCQHGYKGWWIKHDPVTTRRMAYGWRPSLYEITEPIEKESPDAWPHTLWLAPNVEWPDDYPTDQAHKKT